MQPGAAKEKASASRAEGDSRPARGGGVFDDPGEEGDVAAAAGSGGESSAPPADGDGGSSTQALGEAASDKPAPSAEWSAATGGITADMRAHLGRREKKAEADLIKKNRGPIASVLFGLGDFLRSRYFANGNRPWPQR